MVAEMCAINSPHAAAEPEPELDGTPMGPATPPPTDEPGNTGLMGTGGAGQQFLLNAALL